MWNLRAARDADLDFLVEADLHNQGIAPITAPESDRERLDHRAGIASFITDTTKGAWVCEADAGVLAGMILWRFRNIRTESIPAWSVFNRIDPPIFPNDGNFCEIFQLWVDPAYRRMGIATGLKCQAEIESAARGVRMLYTHLETTNVEAIGLNRKLGYHEVRRGPIWDEVERVSMVKEL